MCVHARVCGGGLKAEIKLEWGSILLSSLKCLVQNIQTYNVVLLRDYISGFEPDMVTSLQRSLVTLSLDAKASNPTGFQIISNAVIYVLGVYV